VSIVAAQTAPASEADDLASARQAAEAAQAAYASQAVLDRLASGPADGVVSLFDSAPATEPDPAKADGNMAIAEQAEANAPRETAYDSGSDANVAA